MAACIVSGADYLLLAVIPKGAVKLIGIYIATAGTPAYILLQASIASNVSGYTKKIFYTSAGNLIFYTFGNFVGPLLLKAEDSHRYIPAMSIYVACNAVCFSLFGYIRWNYVRENKKRNKHDLIAVALPDDLEILTDEQFGICLSNIKSYRL